MQCDVILCCLISSKIMRVFTVFDSVVKLRVISTQTVEVANLDLWIEALNSLLQERTQTDKRSHIFMLMIKLICLFSAHAKSNVQEETMK